MDIKSGFSKQLTKINLKASTFLEENKISTFITSLEKDIEGLKLQAGEAAVQMLRSGEFDPETLRPFVTAIEEKEAKIAEQKDKLLEMKARNNEIIGSEPQAGGADNAPKPGEYICPNCGNRLPAAARFCTKCGTKREETV